MFSFTPSIQGKVGEVLRVLHFVFYLLVEGPKGCAGDVVDPVPGGDGAALVTLLYTRHTKVLVYPFTLAHKPPGKIVVSM